MSQLQRTTDEEELTWEFVGAEGNRSESDHGPYVAFVQLALRDYRVFSRFKQNPHYRLILENVSEDEGRSYLEILKRAAPDFIESVERFKENDLIGAPTTYDYDGLGRISPTTLRYMKVASDLRCLFGADIGRTIAEIGVGYGGQLLVNDRVFKMERCDLFDLTPVLALASKYLEAHILNCAYRTTTLNQHTGNETYDLVISNYAFAELPSKLQLKYVEKVISKSRRGYLTMNSGMPDSPFQRDKLSLENLRDCMPPFEVLPETPLSAPGCYIIAWGHE